MPKRYNTSYSKNYKRKFGKAYGKFKGRRGLKKMKAFSHVVMPGVKRVKIELAWDITVYPSGASVTAGSYVITPTNTPAVGFFQINALNEIGLVPTAANEGQRSLEFGRYYSQYGLFRLSGCKLTYRKQVNENFALSLAGSGYIKYAPEFSLGLSLRYAGGVPNTLAQTVLTQLKNFDNDTNMYIQPLQTNNGVSRYYSFPRSIPIFTSDNLLDVATTNTIETVPLNQWMSTVHYGATSDRFASFSTVPFPYLGIAIGQKDYASVVDNTGVAYTGNLKLGTLHVDIYFEFCQGVQNLIP